MKYKYSKIKFSFIGKLVVVFLLINILIPKNINAQDELGIYSVKNFSSKEYNGMVQNWSIVQDSRGVIYAANDQGILEYDGTVWRTILISALAKRGRSLAISEDGTIYVGAVEDFGYLKPDTLLIISCSPSLRCKPSNIFSTIDSGILYSFALRFACRENFTIISHFPLCYYFTEHIIKQLISIK